MNVIDRDAKVKAINAPDVKPSVRAGIADCDIHPTWLEGGLNPYIEKRWQDYIKTFDFILRQGTKTLYPKGQPDAARRDAWPKDGGRPGSSLKLMQMQHLDAHNIQLGMINPLRAGPGMQNLDFAAALSSAVNRWQIAEWASLEPRLKASICIPAEDAQASVAEIDRCASDPSFRQILVLSRTAEPLGNRRYWPIYEAAQRTGRPVGVHAFGASGFPITSGGWGSFYIEDMVNHSAACQSGVASMVIEGVFERFPGLRIVMIEAGLAWLPSLGWRLDKIWKRLKIETPILKRLPSEYIRDHVWTTTQPVEEPPEAEQLRDTIDWIGWDKVLFATDYPHWDFDDPTHVLPLKITDEQKRAFFFSNAATLYGAA